MIAAASIDVTRHQQLLQLQRALLLQDVAAPAVEMDEAGECPYSLRSRL